MTVKRRVVNQCAQCGEAIIAPEWSEYLAVHGVRQAWSCEACGHQFESTIHFAAPEPAANLGGISNRIASAGFLLR
jgi:hypothetical protein